ncbi:methylated-DNA--[protein]-cysteine S-methyltransferase [Marichromatium gracile]|uniref:Methylated-DNA--protein-cysteine methyltransferase n=1 Tax=Marichromatium gracile TaxID=1048 RepID=A0A4R4AB72_MARGR|nr:methylated-DNA--[protein]-cysteine S-methyltransferase [Marichromatium gracile]MBK1709349.1 cysteine methyltransferase [Marichromatium gracile]TCW36251.1 methylated-DNA-[protein]-cysteine S-methyltransferase [Marichromatium gracile]
MDYTRFDTRLCAVVLVADARGLTQLHLDSGERGARAFSIEPDWHHRPERFAVARAEVRAYLDGDRTAFTVPIHPTGTDFQRRVWARLGEIPYGTLNTYGEIARAIGRTGAARAVGAAIGRNPIPLIIPCHRVIGADGGLAGFAHGLRTKQALIDLEAGAR